MERQQDVDSLKLPLLHPLLDEQDVQDEAGYQQLQMQQNEEQLFRILNNIQDNQNRIQKLGIYQQQNDNQERNFDESYYQDQKDFAQKRLFIRDSLDLYEKQQTKTITLEANLQEQAIEINKSQIELIFSLVEFGYRLEEAVIITDSSKAAALQDVFEFLDQNPDIKLHAFQEDNHFKPFQSFGVSQKIELCKECNQLQNEHQYILTSQVNENDKQIDSFSTYFRLSDENKILESTQQINFIRENSQGITQFINVDIEDYQNARRLRKLQPKTDKQCQICYEDMELKDIIYFEGQYHDICQSCFQIFLKESIKEGKVLNLSCPHCSEKLTYKFIQKILDRSTFTKYRQFLLDQLLQLDPLMRWCPNVKCGQSIKLNKGYKRKEQCTQCQSLICTECNREYHKGSCNSVFRKEIKKWEDSSDVQRCEICKTVVAKISGCNHMTCKVCGYEWCWLCGNRYDRIHFFSLNPFGCASLQFRSLVGWKLALYKLLILLLCILIFPFLMILTVPIYFVNLCHRQLYYQKTCVKIIIYPLIFIAGLIVQPIADALFFICLIPGLIIYFYQRRKEKKQQIDKSKQKLMKNQIIKNLGIQIEDLA
ncbi:Ibr domain protein (macronuclear) [Tetrahymena thermophila SB210]|uniref:RBR-type E3 ubiquitin transferase n=1 Tax=Tetrahymena thermophila (strain SB210) TaxID=312017 RepID=I7MJZ2_TETTS|nr:Ibr domain protein [Tetrahymena thermophila SB210]EAS07676.4 Ibr domain protein [Tetrahymena thermophila SB210]|eukprot:XP_001027918.4 Ibr domain protein [Tetrahymena thermophila SB210]